MRRLPLLAALAALSATLLTGAIDSATAAKKPAPFDLQSVSLTPSSDQPGRCVLTLQWTASEPERVFNYLVLGNNAPLKGRNTVDGDVTDATTASWTIDDDSAFYTDVTINYADSRPSKPWSEGSTSWSCLP